MSNEEHAKEPPSHECCHDTSENSSSRQGDDSSVIAGTALLSRVRSYVSGITAAILACICCCLPVVLIAFGVASINSLTWFQNYHLYFRVFGWLVMLIAVFFMWHQHRRAGIHILKDKHFWTPLICMIVVYSGMTYVLETLVAPQFPQAHDLHDHH